MSQLVHNIFSYLAANSEEAAAVGVHENELAAVTRVLGVRVDSEDDLAFAAIDNEAVAGEEDGGFGNGEMGLLFIHELRFHKCPVFHFRVVDVVVVEALEAQALTEKK